MANVIVDKNKIDLLANAIADKSGEPVTMTLDEMVEAVDGIETGGGGITPTGNIDITSAGTTDVTNYATVTVPNASFFVAPMNDPEFYTEGGVRKWRYRSTVEIDPNEGDNAGWIDEGVYLSEYNEMYAVPSNTSITPTESSQTIGDRYYLMEGAVTVNAIPSNYVGTGITRRSSSDLTASGATVSVPSGFYENNASKAVASGTEGTPTATKSAVSNHSVSVTPSVTNDSGYIDGSRITGTPVTVTASELVSGTKSITQNGTGIDVTNYASVDVAVPVGADVPVFTTTDGWQTFTCNKTFAECEALVSRDPIYDREAVNGALVYAVNGLDEYWSGIQCDTSRSVSGVSLVYSAAMDGVCDTEIIYSSNGVITKGQASSLTSLSVTQNGTYTPSYGSVYNEVTVTVSPNLQAKTNIAPTESSQTITADNGYDGLSSVQINAISSSYVGSGITRRSSSDLTASNLTVTAPPGYYASNATKTLTDPNLLATNIKKNVPIFGVTGTYEGSGGESDAHYGYVENTPDSANVLTFQLNGQPTSCFVYVKSSLTPTSDVSQVSAIIWDGGDYIGDHYVQTITNTANAQVSYVNGSVYHSTSGDSPITITFYAGMGDDIAFANETYVCIYSYGTTSTVDTKTQSVGSGATSITFTGLTKTPQYFGCIFTSNFSTSSGYQRVIAVGEFEGDCYGLEMDSSAHYSNAHWSYSYSNGSLTITSQGTNAGGYFHQPGNYLLVYSYDDNASYQDKTVTPTASQQVVEADAGYLGLSSVTVNAIPSDYVGTGITRRSSSDLTASGATVTVPSGFYSSGATKTITNGSVTAPSTISGTTATVTTGTNTLTLTKTVSVTPNVTTAGYISSGTAGNASVSLTASVTTKAAATITPGTTNQTIASGTYLTGTQTISGDANLVGSNILSGKSIFGVAGTVTFQTYYTGSTTPAASLGSNGDIYLQS